MMTAYFPLQEAPAFRSRNLSVRRQFFATITEKPTPRAEDALPPALWIELERRSPVMPDIPSFARICLQRALSAAAPRVRHCVGPCTNDFEADVKETDDQIETFASY